MIYDTSKTYMYANGNIVQEKYNPIVLRDPRNHFSPFGHGFQFSHIQYLRYKIVPKPGLYILILTTVMIKGLNTLDLRSNIYVFRKQTESNPKSQCSKT